MDKYEFKISLNEINALIGERRFEEAANIADGIDWNHVKSAETLCRISEVYKAVGYYDRSRDIMAIAHERDTDNPVIVYALCELTIFLYGRDGLQSDLTSALQLMQEYQASVNASTPSIWPCSGDVSSPYGLRWGGSDYNPGIDIANDSGTPIVATADGVVTDAGWNSGGYGNMVDIDHGNGYMTRYAHAQSVAVAPGQNVKRGQIIAYMGSTGYSTGPHLHYEIRVNGQVVNPAGYL